MSEGFWRRCSSCKKEIAFSVPYWICSVSSCNRKGSSYVFCTVGCWDAHLPTMRHREAWAEEQRAPATAPAAAESTQGAGKRTVIRRTPSPGAAPKPSTPAPPGGRNDAPREMLIVASKLKAYVRARSGMNTSDGVMEELSERVRALCDDAIDRAREEGRKTVMDRDF